MNPIFLCSSDFLHPYPRVCAHRGMCTAAPDNSLPAFGAAVALGADEIELDVLPTRDGHLVSMHDRDLSKISDGMGMAYDCTLEELSRLDFGSVFSPAFKGLKILLFEDVLRKLGPSVIMNVHMKMWDLDIGEPAYEKVAALIHRNNCTRHVYVTSTSLEHLENFHKIAPDIARCTCFSCVKSDPFTMIDEAAGIGLNKIQISRPSAEVIAYAHQKGLKCNVCFAESAEEARMLLEMGADTLMTNHLLDVISAMPR